MRLLHEKMKNFVADKIWMDVCMMKQFRVFGRMAQYAVTTPTQNGCYGLTVGPMGVDRRHFNYDSGPIYQTPNLRAPPFPLNTPVYPAV